MNHIKRNGAGGSQENGISMWNCPWNLTMTTGWLVIYQAFLTSTMIKSQNVKELVDLEVIQAYRSG
jgi:hypothetical protein